MSPIATPAMTVRSSTVDGAFRVFGERPFCADAELLAVAFGPDGDLWSVEDPGVLRHWDGAGRQKEWHFLTELATVWCFRKDGGVLASGSDELSLWDVASGRLLRTLPQPSWITAIALDDSGQLLATGHDDGSIRLWDIASEFLLRELQGHDRPVSALAFRNDAKMLASAGEDKSICLWASADGEQPRARLLGHTDRIPALAWHPDGRRLISAGWDTTARVWDATTHEPLILLNAHVGQVTALALSQDGKVLASVDSANRLYIWDAMTYRLRHRVKDCDGEIHSLAFSPDGGQLAGAGSERLIYLWDANTAQRRGGGIEPGVVCAHLDVSPDGERLATVGGGTSLSVWDTATGQALIERPAGETLHAVAYSADGKTLATAGSGLGIRLWDAATGAVLRTLEGPATPVSALAFAPTGHMLASACAGNGDIWLWDVRSGEPVLLLPDALDGCIVQALAFDASGRFLAAGGIDWLATRGADGAVAVWDVTERRDLALFNGSATSVAFHPTGKLLAAASLDRTVQLWDLKTQQLTAQVTGHKEAVNSVAFSPDGRWLATGSDDHTVRLWEAETGAPISATQLDSQIKTLRFSPDGRYLYTGNGNTSCYQIEVARLLP